MNKEKLIQALKYFYDNLLPEICIANDNEFETLCNEIQNGEFDKKPCPRCKISCLKYCADCGRELSK